MNATHNRLNEVMLRHTQIIKNLAGILVVFLVIAMIVFFDGIALLRKDASLINDMGKIRGNSQRIVKLEIMGIPDDDLIAHIDEIVHSIRSQHLSGFAKDEKFMQDYEVLNMNWDNLKEVIYETRDTKDFERLLAVSEDFFGISDQLVEQSQIYAEGKMNKTLSYRPYILTIIAILVIVYVILLFFTNQLTKQYSLMQGLAIHDSLTGLFSRNYFNQKIDAYAEMSPMPELTCIFFDLNNLKITNDTYGHDAGNLLLEQFAAFIRDTFSGHGDIFRYGGDEMIALLRPGEYDVEELIENLNRQVREWNALSEQVKISYAHGIAHSYEEEVKTMHHLIAAADVRMYQCKQRMKQAGIGVVFNEY